MQKREKSFVYNRDGKLIWSNRFAWLAYLIAWFAKGEVKHRRGYLSRSARCRLYGGRKMVRCLIVAERPRSYRVRIPDGTIIVRRRAWVVK